MKRYNQHLVYFKLGKEYSITDIILLSKTHFNSLSEYKIELEYSRIERGEDIYVVKEIAKVDEKDVESFLKEEPREETGFTIDINSSEAFKNYTIRKYNININNSYVIYKWNSGKKLWEGEVKHYSTYVDVIKNLKREVVLDYGSEDKSVNTFFELAGDVLEDFFHHKKENPEKNMDFFEEILKRMLTGDEDLELYNRKKLIDVFFKECLTPRDKRDIDIFRDILKKKDREFEDLKITSYIKEYYLPSTTKLTVSQDSPCFIKDYLENYYNITLSNPSDKYYLEYDNKLNTYNCTKV